MSDDKLSLQLTMDMTLDNDEKALLNRIFEETEVESIKDARNLRDSLDKLIKYHDQLNLSKSDGIKDTNHNHRNHSIESVDIVKIEQINTASPSSSPFQDFKCTTCTVINNIERSKINESCIVTCGICLFQMKIDPDSGMVLENLDYIPALTRGALKRNIGTNGMNMKKFK